jgi:hypothetical protein
MHPRQKQNFAIDLEDMPNASKAEVRPLLKNSKRTSKISEYAEKAGNPAYGVGTVTRRQTMGVTKSTSNLMSLNYNSNDITIPGMRNEIAD